MPHPSVESRPTRRHRAPSHSRRAARRDHGTAARRLTLSTLTAVLLALALGVPLMSGAAEEGPSPVAQRLGDAAELSPAGRYHDDDDREDDDRQEERASRGAARERARSAAAARSAGMATPPRGSGSDVSSGTVVAPTGTGDTTAAAADGVVRPAGNAPFLPYSADSYFRSPLPSVTPVSPDNARLVAFARSANRDPYLKIRGTGGNAWGIAYAEADCSDPIYRIGAGRVPASQAHLQAVGFHAPASLWANIPPNADAPFLVVDRCGTSARPGGMSVWGAGTSVTGGTVNVTYTGSFAHDSNGLDRRNPLADSQLNERSRGVIPDSMLIRLDALDYAIRTGSGLGHVLEVFWVETDTAAGFAHPMVGAEGGKAGAGAEGQRFRIKPGIDLASRPGCDPRTNPVGLAIARTLQQHGAYLGDNSGSGSGIKTEQNAKFPGLTADSLQGCMTWDDIEFLPLGWQG